MDKDEFIKHWVGFAYTVARAMQRTYELSEFDTEDIVQTALARLTVLTPSQRKKGDAYTKTVINNRSRDALQRILKIRNTVSIDNPLPDGENTFADTFVGSKEDELNAVRRLTLAGLMEACDEQTQNILTLAFGLNGREPQSYTAISKAIGIPPRRVKDIITEACNVMRESAEPKQFRAVSSCCVQCGNEEILLLPVDAADPDVSICMNCEQLLPCIAREPEIAIEMTCDL